MKRFILFFGVLFILQNQLFCQETEFMAKKDFQVEKARLQESIYKLSKNNQELKQMILIQAQVNDSLAQLLVSQSETITLQQEAIQLLESSQSSFDDRLLTQRKSGTLIAILIPAGLFLFTLLVLIWLLIFRHRMLSLFNHLDDRWNELSKRLDDQVSKFERDHGSIRSEIQSSSREAEIHIQKLSGETAEKLVQLERLINEVQAAHEARHQESHQEYEAFKSSLEKGIDSFSHDLSKLREELSGTAKDFAAKLKEMIKQRPDKG
ncbi:MAG: hypothetical protein JXA23_06065 [Bacteroidales bacterium]|nr:hypothetical protein [Bacteroidales bacterium]